MKQFCITGVAALLCLAITAQFPAAAAEYKAEHCTVVYEGVGEEYAAAFASVLDFTWDYYHSTLSLNLPEQVFIHVSAGKYRTRLWTDGTRQIALDLADSSDLHPNSGYFHIYGICQQLGLISLYSGMKNTAGMPDGVGPGWGHYLGSLAVDQLWETYGTELWPVPYDYSGNGTSRLRYQCASPEKDAAVLAACTFLAIGDEYGHVKVCQTMKGALKGEPEGNELMGRFAKILDGRVADGASAMIPDSVRRSPANQEGEVIMLPDLSSNISQAWTDDSGWTGYDDDDEDGMRSLAGGSHGIEFHVDGGGSLTGIQIKGARYGYPSSDSSFTMSVYDREMQLIQRWDWPYMMFGRRGEPLYWVEFNTAGVVVPEDFIVIFDFAPEQTNGVYVGYDSNSSGHSYSSQIGNMLVQFNDGDWMIRVRID